MSRDVAFLRAINVGGRVVKMERLRAEFEGLGLAGVETFIASGNEVFESRAGAAALGARIATRLERAFGWEVATFLRTVDEVAAVAAYAAFPPAVFERTLGVPATFRGLATVRKIADRFRPAAAGARANRPRPGA